MRNHAWVKINADILHLIEVSLNKSEQITNTTPDIQNTTFIHIGDLG